MTAAWVCSSIVKSGKGSSTVEPGKGSFIEGLVKGRFTMESVRPYVIGTTGGTDMVWFGTWILLRASIPVGMLK